MSDNAKLLIALERAKKRVSGDSRGKIVSVADQLSFSKEVPMTSEVRRILALPSREWSLEEMQELAVEMTPLLAHREGPDVLLRPMQALALHDLGAHKGLICTAGVGSGKTLVLFLAAYIMKALRPLVLIPANLREKTERDFNRYRKTWNIPEFVRIEHYETLSTARNADFWEDYRPDCVMCDEAHHLKNTGAVVPIRLKRYLKEIRPNTPLGLLSGSITKNSIKDYWHLLRWIYGNDRMPLPSDYQEMEMWSLALDNKVGVMNRMRPGALKHFFNDEERELFKTDSLKAARKAYGRRLNSTPGIVRSLGNHVDASLVISPFNIQAPESVMDAFSKLREEWVTPSGEDCQDGAKAAMRADEYSLGFYYIWDPPPPEDWKKARKDWSKACRTILAHNRKRLDSEQQVKDALDAGIYPTMKEYLDRWRELEKTYKINVKPVWIHDFAIQAVAKWAKKNAGIVWVQQIAFGERLAEFTGMPYYRYAGKDKDGRYIEDHPKGQSLIASIASNREGRNLQEKWNRNLVTSPPGGGDWWEQMMGRTHRIGQPEDTVFFELLISSVDQIATFEMARKSAEYIQDSSLEPQKLCFADISVQTLDEIGKRGGALWQRGEVSAKGIAVPNADPEFSTKLGGVFVL